MLTAAYSCEGGLVEGAFALSRVYLAYLANVPFTSVRWPFLNIVFSFYFHVDSEYLFGFDFGFVKFVLLCITFIDFLTKPFV